MPVLLKQSKEGAKLGRRALCAVYFVEPKAIEARLFQINEFEL